MEDGRGQHGVRPAHDGALDQVFQCPHASRGHHRYAHRIDHGPGQGQIKPVLGPIAVHAGEQDLTGPVGGAFNGPADHVTENLERFELHGLPPSAGKSSILRRGFYWDS